MLPGMVFLILRRDADFVTETKPMLQGRLCAAQVATSAREMRRMEEQADVEMAVWDPAMKVG
jgi:hypothetical protein